MTPSEMADADELGLDRQELPAVVLKPKRALPFFSQHPWVFSGAIKRVEPGVQPGDAVRLMTHDGKFVAYGLFNPDSNIRVRLYSWDAEQPLTDELWVQRLDAALSWRKRLFPDWTDRSACRLVSSEADRLSGLTVDRYGQYLLVQLTSRALADRREILFDTLRNRLGPRGIWLRTEKGMGENESLELSDGLVWGATPPRPLFIEEHGLRFGIDVVAGQKTGHFLDQRDNRRRVAELIQGQRVLDVFCYTGGFSIAAVKLGRAGHCVAIDSSTSALETARANAALNDCAAQIDFRQGDAYKMLEQLIADGSQFDTVIVDPPKMARHRPGVERALRGYFSLNRLALNLLPANGLLVTCCCSGLVSNEAFEQMLSSVALQSNRSLQIVAQYAAAPDHPVSTTCLENRYLKCYVCRVG